MEDVNPKVVFVGKQEHPSATALEGMKDAFECIYCPTPTALQQHLTDAIAVVVYPLDSPLPITSLRIMLPQTLPFIALAMEASCPQAMTEMLTTGVEQVLVPAQWHLLPLLVQRLMHRADQRQHQLHTRQSLQAFLMESADPIFSYHVSLEEWTFANHSLLSWLGYTSYEEWVKQPLESILVSGRLDHPQRGLPTPQACQLRHKDGHLLEGVAHPLELKGLKDSANPYWKVAAKDGKKASVWPWLPGQADSLTHHAEQVPGVMYQFQLMTDERIIFPFISDHMSDLCAVPLDELRQNGNLIFQYMHPDDLTPFLTSGRQSRQDLTIWSLDYRLRGKEGHYNWVRGKSKPVRLPDGSVLWYGYMEDITEEKKAQEALRNSEERARTLFQYAPDAIVIIDIQGAIVQWNPKAEVLFGWTAEEVQGRLIHEIIAPLRNHLIYQECFDAYEKHGGGVLLNQPLELQARNRSGHEFTIKLAMSSMNIKGQTYFSCFMNDITARKQAQAAVQRSLKEKEVLLKEIHHRVKNNLQVITSLLSLQASFANDPAIVDIFKKSQYRINSMGMVHEMLYQSQDLSRINYADYLHRLTTGLIRAMLGSQSPIRLQLNVPQVLLNVDTAIPLSLIVNEAVTNSLKYGFPDGRAGTIYLALEPEREERYTLYIGDDGIGYAAAPSTAPKPSLGLLLMRKLAVQLKGEITHLTERAGTHYRLRFQEIYQ